MVVGSRDNERDAAAANMSVPLYVSFGSSVKLVPTTNPSVKSRRSTKAASMTSKAAPSVSSRRSKASSVKNEMRAIEAAADTSIDDNISHAKSRKSMRSTLSKKEGQSIRSGKVSMKSKSPAKPSTSRENDGEDNITVPKTKPLDMIQIDNSSMASTQRKTQSDAEFWSGLSIRVALAVMKTKGSQQIAQKASCLVLYEGQMQDGKETGNEMLQAFAVKLSTALMELDGDERVAAAAALAVVESQPSVNSGEAIEIDNLTIATFGTKRSNLTKASKK